MAIKKEQPLPLQLLQNDRHEPPIRSAFGAHVIINADMPGDGGQIPFQAV